MFFFAAGSPNGAGGVVDAGAKAGQIGVEVAMVVSTVVVVTVVVIVFVITVEVEAGSASGTPTCTIAAGAAGSGGVKKFERIGIDGNIAAIALGTRPNAATKSFASIDGNIINENTAATRSVFSSLLLCGMGESNSRSQFGKLMSYH